MNEWISTKEQLPPEGVKVLAYQEHVDKDTVWVAFRNSNGAWIAKNGQLILTLGVTHWMPLNLPNV